MKNYSLPFYTLKTLHNGDYIATEGSLIKCRWDETFLGEYSMGIYKEVREIPYEFEELISVKSTVNITSEVETCQRIEEVLRKQGIDIRFSRGRIDFLMNFGGAEAKLKSPLLTYPNITQVVDYLRSSDIGAILLFSLTSDEYYYITCEKQGQELRSTITPDNVAATLLYKFCCYCPSANCLFGMAQYWCQFKSDNDFYLQCPVYGSLKTLFDTETMKTEIDWKSHTISSVQFSYDSADSAWLEIFKEKEKEELGI